MGTPIRINASEISETVSRLCQDANFNLGSDVVNALALAREKEASPVAK